MGHNAIADEWAAYCDHVRKDPKTYEAARRKLWLVAMTSDNDRGRCEAYSNYLRLCFALYGDRDKGYLEQLVDEVAARCRASAKQRR